MKNAIIAVLVLALAAAVYYLWRVKKNSGQSNSVVTNGPSLGDSVLQDIASVAADADQFIIR